MEPPGASKDERISRAKESLVAAMPPPEHYAGVSADLIAGLQKRDTKWQTCISSTLVSELGDALLPTTLLDLTFEEAQEMKAMSSSISQIPSRPVLQALATRMEALWRAQYPSSTGDLTPIFCKLSFMSPKELAVRTSFAPSHTNYVQHLQRLFAEAPLLDRVIFIERLTHHPRLPELWLSALNNSLQVRSPMQAITLLCSSSRCQEELNDALIDRRFFRLSIVLRPWVKIRPGFEFRIYVCNGSITCASQYEPVYFPDVWAARDTLPDVLGRFVRDRVIPKLRHRLPSFVVDVVMLDNAKNTLAVCELNPFAASSSACLFSWRTDQELLLLGPETWRFTSPEHASKHTKELLSQEWMQVTARCVSDMQSRLLLTISAAAVIFALLAFAGAWKMGALGR